MIQNRAKSAVIRRDWSGAAQPVPEALILRCGMLFGPIVAALGWSKKPQALRGRGRAV